jgi:ApaG protein
MNNISILVTPEYLEEQSLPEKNQYTFAYHIRIENHGQEPAKLLSRHWIITDGNAQVKEIQGPGVVGEQPLIDPGKSYEYTSGVTLETQVGTMEGSYQMVSNTEEQFDAPIPPFRLSVPGVVH